MYEDYGNLAGFASFAGAADTSDVPVVRYQDLQRSHAPASAGAVAVYQNPNALTTARQGDPEENLDGYGDVAYGDVAYGETHPVPPEFAGVQPLPIPTSVPVYGAANAADKKKSAREADEDEEKTVLGESFYRAFQASAGLQTGREDKQQVAAPVKQAAPSVDWQKVALWGGVAVGGILLTVVIVKAVKS